MVARRAGPRYPEFIFYYSVTCHTRTMKNLLVAMFSAALLLQGATNYKVVARYPVPGNGGFDYVGIDSAARRVYLSHATQVDVIDADTGKVVGAIAHTPDVPVAA